MTQEEMDKIYNYFNNQKGQNYPCSNQVVINGFFTNDENKWLNFIKSHKNNIIRRRRNEILLDNKESWIYATDKYGHIRGYRFYKVKIDKTLNERFIKECILPCCNFYCKEFEWI